MIEGMTEVGGVAAIQTNASKKIESIGYVAANTEIKVVDIETGKSLGPNKLGECYIKTPTIMIGYYKNKAATDETLDEEGKLE